ncbi:carboxypeptidase regulatory-like domain-containing protein [Terrabacter sp. LjRoot27]
MLTATTVALGLLPLAAPSASAATYTITGRVTGLSSTGTVVGVPDAGLWIYDADYDYAGSVTFGSDGTYTATFGSPGPYKIQAGCWGTMTCASQWGIEWYLDKGSFEDATEVTAGATPTVADIRLDRRSTIKGTVRNILGQPVQAAEVSVSKSTGGQVVTATPASDGTFTLTGVEAGPSNLHAEDTSGQHLYEGESWNGTASTPDYVDWSVPAGATVTGVNFVLDPWTGVVVKVTDAAGTPLQNINWNLYEYRPTEGDWLGRQYGPLLTGADGTFAEGTDVGTTYKICVYDTWYYDWAPATRYQDRCYDGAATLETATPFTVTTDTRRRELTLVLPVAGKGLTAREPFVSGTGSVGSTLSVDAGAWGPSGVALSYQWMSAKGNGGLVAIPGATGPSFTLTSDLAGAYVTARVTGTLAGYRTAQFLSNGVEVRTSAATLSSPLTISGTGVVGSTLTASHGTISPADDWYPSYTWVVGGVPRPTDYGGVQPLAVTSDMVGKRVTLRMAGWTENNGSLQQAASGPVVTAGTLTAATPTVTGTARVGTALTAAPGTWGPAPVSLAYQWLAGGVAVSGATASTFTPTATELGKTVTVRVTGSKAGYTSVSRTSAATAAVVAGTLTAPTPTISGTKAVGYTLTAVPGSWGPAPVTLTYQWYRSGTAISGATASTYTLTTADQTKTMTVKVTGTKAGFTSAARTSAATTAVLGALTAPTPTISGTKAVGYTLTAVPGSWGPAPVTLTYQWYRSGTAISGATASTYRLTTTDQTKTITVKVTGSKSGYLTVARTSAATTAVLGSFTAPTPTLSGTQKVGYTLTANPGTWSPAPTTLTYQWYRSGTAISGATAKTYKVTSTDKGTYVKVRVTGAKSGYLTKSISSAQTAAIG